MILKAICVFSIFAALMQCYCLTGQAMQMAQVTGWVIRTYVRVGVYQDNANKAEMSLSPVHLLPE